MVISAETVLPCAMVIVPELIVMETCSILFGTFGIDNDTLTVTGESVRNVEDVNVTGAENCTNILTFANVSSDEMNFKMLETELGPGEWGIYNVGVNPVNALSGTCIFLHMYCVPSVTIVAVVV